MFRDSVVSYPLMLRLSGVGSRLSDAGTRPFGTMRSVVQDPVFSTSGDSGVVGLKWGGKGSKKAQAGSNNWHKVVVIASPYRKRLVCVLTE